jgi:tetratricopeptide (TPR) repeat protein
MLTGAGPGSRASGEEPRPASATSATCLATGQTLWPYTPADSGTSTGSPESQEREGEAPGSPQARIDRLRSQWAQDPQNGKYAQALTLAYIHLKSYPLAESVIARYKSECGSTALTHGLESELHFQQQQYETAFHEARESIKISDQNPRMHEILGLIYAVRRSYQNALPELEIAARQAPDNPQVRYFYGRNLYTTGHYPEATKEFLACLHLNPKHVRALENLGLCYEALGEFSKAVDSYKQAITLRSAEPNSKDVEAYAYYGTLQARLGQNTEAVATLQKALSINPRSFRANYELGKLSLDHGDLDQAERYLFAAVKLVPTFSQTYYLIGRMYIKEHRQQDAQNYFAVFQQLNNIPANREFPYPRE